MKSRFQRKNQRKSRKQYAGSDDKFCQSLNYLSGHMNDVDDKDLEGYNLKDQCNQFKKPDECPLQQIIKYSPDWKDFYDRMKIVKEAPHAPYGSYRNKFNEYVKYCSNYKGNDEETKQFCKAFLVLFKGDIQTSFPSRNAQNTADINLQDEIENLTTWANSGSGNDMEPMCGLCMDAESDAFLNEFSSQATGSERKKYLSERVAQCNQAAKPQTAGRRRLSKRSSYRIRRR
jgi:hypothetical protein